MVQYRDFSGSAPLPFHLPPDSTGYTLHGQLGPWDAQWRDVRGAGVDAHQPLDSLHAPPHA